ncbi:hypothetical protein TSOC_006475 [Tetrabaena socialis]|uniref:Uncharacterized protein n=1 Tax=Tetrabaena socialis TaxID=47790 RepID=A0A2J8A3K2_9CHLO|nr:hypothetical protein TSOC_006475 [Tetrabaena socialis]|eukprot:PNH07094.1 hypothetical protein TSOC_006475 [Tetrabaena socialis]
MAQEEGTPLMRTDSSTGAATGNAVNSSTRVELEASTLQGTPCTVTLTVSPSPRSSVGKPRPLMVSSVPPAAEPSGGQTPVISAYCWNMSVHAGDSAAPRAAPGSTLVGSACGTSRSPSYEPRGAVTRLNMATTCAGGCRPKSIMNSTTPTDQTSAAAPSKIDDMGQKIDTLEATIGELLEQAGSTDGPTGGKEQS